jgi:hypothetical protein
VLTVNAGTLAIEARSAGADIVNRNHPVYLTGLNLGPAGPAYDPAAGGNNGGNYQPGTEVGALDLADHDLVVDYTGGSSPFTTIQKYVIDGHYVGPFNKGILTKQHVEVTGGNILLIFDNAVGIPALNLAPGAITEWPPNSGHTVPSTAVLGKYSFIGDTNLDGKVTGDDYAPVDIALSNNIGITAGATYFDGDMDLNGTVDSQDYSPIDQNINVSDPDNPYVPMLTELTTWDTAGLAADSLVAPATSAVPEPSMFGLLTIMGAGTLTPRRRKVRAPKASP